jgi:hypothetical protein
MKDLSYEYWNWVEIKCDKMFKEITELNNRKKAENPSYHELQIWCSDMWAVLWKGWLMGKNTITHPNFEFSWSTSSEADYHKMNIMHNAGVTDNNSGLFYKAQYIYQLPYNQSPEPNKHTANWHYWDWVQKTAEKSCLI